MHHAAGIDRAWVLIASRMLCSSSTESTNRSCRPDLLYRVPAPWTQSTPQTCSSFYVLRTPSSSGSLSPNMTTDQPTPAFPENTVTPLLALIPSAVYILRVVSHTLYLCEHKSSISDISHNGDLRCGWLLACLPAQSVLLLAAGSRRSG